MIYKISIVLFFLLQATSSGAVQAFPDETASSRLGLIRKPANVAEAMVEEQKVQRKPSSYFDPDITAAPFSTQIRFETQGLGNTIYKDLTGSYGPAAQTVFWVGAGLTTALTVTRDQVSDRWSEDMSRETPLNESSKYGDYAGQTIPNVLYALGMYGHGYLTGSQRSRTNAKLMFKATTYAGLTTLALKNISQQPRPEDSDNRHSFPSGHTTVAFAFASVVACRHSAVWGVLAYGLATFVAASRVNDKAHYVHDTVAGATLGTTYGLGMCYMEKNRSALFLSDEINSKPKREITWGVTPQDEGVTGQLQISF